MRYGLDLGLAGGMMNTVKDLLLLRLHCCDVTEKKLDRVLHDWLDVIPGVVIQDLSLNRVSRRGTLVD